MTDAKETVINNILTRRTIRRFLDRQIGEEELQTVLEAGLYAPSAGGRQGVLFVVSQNLSLIRDRFSADPKYQRDPL